MMNDDDDYGYGFYYRTAVGLEQAAHAIPEYQIGCDDPKHIKKLKRALSRMRAKAQSLAVEAYANARQHTPPPPRKS